MCLCVFFFQAEDGIRAGHVTGVQTCALPIYRSEPMTVHAITSARYARVHHDELAGRVLDLMADHPAWQLPLGYRDGVYGARSEERRVGKESRSRRGPSR